MEKDYLFFLDSFLHDGYIKSVEVKIMANNKQPNSNTDVQRVKQQNAQSAQGGQNQFGTEFASETDAQHVKQQNQKAESRKQQNS